MANYEPYGRSSYFRVKDPVAFRALCAKYQWEPIQQGADSALVGFLCEGEEAFPSSRFNEDTQQDEEVDSLDELAALLADGWAAECREIGYEKMRYLVGWTTVITWDGRRHTVSLDDAGAAAQAALGPLQLTSPDY